MDSGLLRPGSRRLSIAVNGNTIAAGLMRNGTISYGGETGKEREAEATDV